MLYDGPMRLFAFLLFGSLIPLGACSNRVVSETPWLQEEAAATRPRFRDGVWRDEDRRCKISEAKPAELWPACASWRYLRGNQAFTPQWSEEVAGRKGRRTYEAWSMTESVVVSGDPIIAQSRDCALAPVFEDALTAIEVEQQAATKSATGPETSAHQPRANFCYDAMLPISFDDAGRMTIVEIWPIFCGPWSRNGGRVTDQPWPGLSIVGENCNAESEIALREAARRSREIALELQMIVRAHWVRDGYH